MTFLEKDYKLPETSNYMKFKEGDNTFRVLSSAITGWEYWNTKGKPIRRKEEWSTVPDDIRDGSEIKHFWAFVVWNYEASRVQILELTQKGIITYMRNLLRNKAWGDPHGYDIVVTREGSGFDTTYTCAANPPSEVDKDIISKYESKTINLEALYEGADPFALKEEETEDIPFD